MTDLDRNGSFYEHQRDFRRRYSSETQLFEFPIVTFNHVMKPTQTF